MKRRTLTREKVILTATQLANDAGDYRNIGLKDVAKALDIRVPSLYNHVKGVDGLRLALRAHALRLIERALRDAMSGKTGRDALRSAAHAYRTFAHANPGIYPLVIVAGDDAATGDDAAEIKQTNSDILSLLLLMLGSYGLSGDDAYHTVRGLRAILHGFVSLEVIGGFGMPLDTNESYSRLIDGWLDSLGR